MPSLWQTARLNGSSNSPVKSTAKIVFLLMSKMYRRLHRIKPLV